MNILDLVTVIADKEGQGRVKLDSYLSLMLQNLKVNNYLPLDGEGCCITNDESMAELENILMGEINEFGIYLYDFTGHTGEWFVKEVNSINDAEKHILSPGGYLNMFCTTLLVIYKGKIKGFRVYETLQNGEKQYVEDDQDCINRDKVIVEWT